MQCEKVLDWNGRISTLWLLTQARYSIEVPKETVPNEKSGGYNSCVIEE